MRAVLPRGRRRAATAGEGDSRRRGRWSCGICGYGRYAGALQFHHLDPESKAFTINGNGTTRALTALRSEARKCALLCANCHAEVEAGLAALPYHVEQSPGGAGDPG